MSAIKQSILINNTQYRFKKEFFSPNEVGRRSCSHCLKKGLGRYQRVDVEFFGDETLCIRCWIKEVYHV